jgi:uncharacterized lipoprotein YmbA
MRTIILLCCLAANGCLSKLGAGDPTPIRFYSAAPAVGEVTGDAAGEPGPSLRMRRVTAAVHLRERMVWRADDVEYGFYESRRWTEQPAAWVEAALANELAGAHGVVCTEHVGALTLDVNLIGFEEVLSPHGARVGLELNLTSRDGAKLLATRVEANVPIARDEGGEVARSMRKALQDAVTEAATAVAAALAGHG